ncbi:ATP-binding protein [Streptomyces sp. NPDC050546]|uniref:ATP-binding protein n=1 Tax=Streptomyces sp. NPDC050546 TaxID=3365628 RepID=UPI003799E8D2
MSGCEATEPHPRCVLPFAAAPAEVRLLRRAVVRQLTRWDVLIAADETELLVTELATNVVKHVGAGGSAALILERRGERLRLEVHDQSPVLPVVRTATCGDESGRGLRLLAATAVDWGTVLTAAGKAVWCEIPLADGHKCRRVERAVLALENYERDACVLGLHGRGREVSLVESAVELIADLLHWTTARGHDPDDILDRAQMHYEAVSAAA